tara:strand:- start:1114 stop:1611 length:498 start_codon:yes stop_codon:yes gene_type:complete
VILVNKLICKNDEVYFLKKFLSERECNKYFKKIPDIGYVSTPLPWEKRVFVLHNDPIVKKVNEYLNKRFNLKLLSERAEMQNHHVNSQSNLHIHDDWTENITYNSLIYLNDDFDGGQFFTKNGISIKPEKGMLTFFNGRKTYHGVKKVLNKDRKTIIFWWDDNKC